MLFKRKVDTPLHGGMVSFLNKVDSEYMMAFNTKSIRNLQPYLTRDCGIKVSQHIHGVGSRYFGAAKFRDTKWLLEQETNGTLIIRKEVYFDKINIAGAMKVAVANDYVEKWVIDTTCDPAVVMDIEQVK